MRFLLLSLSTIIYFSSCFYVPNVYELRNGYSPRGIVQPEQYRGKFNEFLGPEEKVIFTWYHQMFSQNSEGEYIKRTFFPETKTLIALEHFDYDFKVKNGVAKYWYDDGSLMVELIYKNGEINGQKKEYTFKTGELFSEGNYALGKKEGVYKYYHSKNRIKEKTMYVNDEMQGEQIRYDTLGNITYQAIFDNGEMVEELVKSKEVFKIVEFMPCFPGCSQMEPGKDKNMCASNKMLKFIYSNITYPAVARRHSMEGTAVVTFVVGKTGKIKNIEVRRGICQSIKNECYRVVSFMPEWEPGMQGGKPVKVQYNLPIHFKLK